jgi:hypothetical protein
VSSPFGWDYPAGAENDPDAPWNQHDEEEDDGEGETQQEMRDRIDEDKADAARDEEVEKEGQK